MEKVCRECGGQVAHPGKAEVCPACGGALVERVALDRGNPVFREVDHRGMVLPPRHAVGGVITPR